MGGGKNVVVEPHRHQVSFEVTFMNVLSYLLTLEYLFYGRVFSSPVARRTPWSP